MTYDPRNAQTAVATVTAALACAGPDQDPALIDRTHGVVMRLLEDLGPDDLDDVIWILSGWFADVLDTVQADDPTLLLQRLGQTAAARAEESST